MTLERDQMYMYMYIYNYLKLVGMIMRWNYNIHLKFMILLQEMKFFEKLKCFLTLFNFSFASRLSPS